MTKQQPSTRQSVLSTLKSKKVWASAIIIALLVCFLLRGVIRMSIAPYAVYTRYQHSLQQSYERFQTELGNPIGSFALSGGESVATNCTENTAQRLYIEVGCYKMESKQTANIDSTYIAKFSPEFKKLQTKLDKNGWAAASSEGITTSLTDLVNGTSEASKTGGYYGSITFSKTINGNRCTLIISRFEHMRLVQECGRTSKIGIN